MRQPKRAAPAWPTDPPLRPPVRALRVTKDFTAEGLWFREGQLVSPDNKLVQAIAAEHPEYLQPAR
jgi:hypothetical protein